MNGRPLTDAKISQALRAHLPERADPGLRERILDAAETTIQQRALPSFFGALSAADPVVRRRGLLIAAALLVALALASVAAVGALRLLQPDLRDLSLVPLPSPRGVVAPSSTPSEPSAGPTSSAVPRSTGVWIPTGTMRTPRIYVSTAVRLVDGRVLVAGGLGAPADGVNARDLTSAELYDPASGTWSATGNMVIGGEGTGTLLRDGKVLVVGVGERSAEVYDPASGTWTATEKMISGAGFATTTLLRDGTVLVAGLNGAQLYDPDSGHWTATGKMVTPRYNTTATLLPDGRVLVAGGDVPPDRAVDSAELYDPETGLWTATANMRATGNERYDHIRATLLPDGTVLVVRTGPCGSQMCRTSAALYDPATGTWTATGDMARPDLRYFLVTRLLDGTVLVAHGLDGNNNAANGAAEVYDPATRSWTETGNMLRSHGTPGVLLRDGTVLVAGGDDCQDGVCIATGSAELYVPRGVSPPTLPAFPSPPPPVFPSPTPRPTPFPPAAGPVPAGARSWKVTVVNEVSNPATLFLAEEGENAMGKLCGSVTPNVVPPNTTMKVTFLLPPKTVKSCWIWVNPPPGGELFQTSDAPLAGKILIMEGGEEGEQVGWVGP